MSNQLLYTGCYVKLRFLHESATTTAAVDVMPSAIRRKKPKYRGRKLDEGYLNIIRRDQPVNTMKQVWQTAKQGGSTKSIASFATKDVKSGEYKGWNTPSTVRQDPTGKVVKGSEKTKM
jgi:hypothetical protein